jgi:hypothetical protein
VTNRRIKEDIMRFGGATTSPRWQPVVMVLMSASLVVACSGDGTSPLTSLDATLPEGSRPPLTAPPVEPDTEEPAPEPAPEPSQPALTAPAPEPEPEPAPAPVAPTVDDEGLTGEEWALLIVIGVAVLAIVIGAASLASRRTRRRNQQRTTYQQRLDDITRGCRSIHDSAVLSILQTSNPVMLQSTFAAARNQLIDLEGRASTLAAELSDESARRSLHDLGLAVAGVRGALETNVGLRVDPEGPGQGELIDASNRTVLHRSDQLESALQQVLYLTL